MAARPLLAPPSSAAAASPTLAWASPTLAWGSQGLARTFEETPRGASSFTFDAAGRAVVVDELGHRVVVLDESGKPARAVALPHPHADEVLVSRGGQLVVLDRRDTGTVSVERADGGWSTIQLSGAGVDEPRAVSRLVEHEGGLYVQRDGNGPLLKVGDTSGRAAAEPAELQGIPTRDGRFLVSAGVTDAERGRVWVNLARAADATHVWTRELRLPVEVGAVGLVDTDDHGRVYVVSLGETREGVYSNWLTCLAQADGKAISTQSFPVQPRWESFRDFEVRPSGGLVVAMREPDGLRFVTVSCDGQ
ncbi:MAG: hypothetical protein JNL38_00285 [Myxococcales bacterium]|nr:hypothetical protein [Myxococcales bacterium]